MRLICSSDVPSPPRKEPRGRGEETARKGDTTTVYCWHQVKAAPLKPTRGREAGR